MSRGEILSLRWEHVNIGHLPRAFIIKGESREVAPGRFLIEKSKSGRPRRLPMNGQVRGLFQLSSLNETRGDFVFQNKKTGAGIADIKTGFTSACRDAGIDNLTFHDLRRTWATRAAECGVPESVARDILGHDDDRLLHTHLVAGDGAGDGAGGQLFP